MNDLNYCFREVMSVVEEKLYYAAKMTRGITQDEMRRCTILSMDGQGDFSRYAKKRICQKKHIGFHTVLPVTISSKDICKSSWRNSRDPFVGPFIYFKV